MLFPPNAEYGIQDIEVYSGVCPVTIEAYGAWFKVLGGTATGFKIANLRHVFKGGTFRTADVSDTTTAIELTQAAGATNVSYNRFRDINIIDMYKGIDGFMGKTTYPTEATFRHTFDNLIIRNTTNGSKSWVGSRGIVLGGTTVGDSTGNDSKIINSLIAGYETAVYSNGVRTSVRSC